MKNVSFLTNPHVVTIEQSLIKSDIDEKSFSLGNLLLQLFLGILFFGLIYLLFSDIIKSDKLAEKSKKAGKDDGLELEKPKVQSIYWI